MSNRRYPEIILEKAVVLGLLSGIALETGRGRLAETPKYLYLEGDANVSNTLPRNHPGKNFGDSYLIFRGSAGMVPNDRRHSGRFKFRTSN